MSLVSRPETVSCSLQHQLSDNKGFFNFQNYFFQFFLSVAAWGIFGTIWDAVNELVDGIADASEVRCAFLLGSGEPKKARLSAYKSMMICFFSSLFVTSGLYMAGDSLPTWMTNDPTLQHLLKDLMPLFGLGNGAMTLGTMSWTLLGAQGRYRLATVTVFVVSWVITLPLAAILSIHLRIDLQGQTAVVVLGFLTAGSIHAYFLFRSDWPALSKRIIDDNASRASDEPSTSEDAALTVPSEQPLPSSLPDCPPSAQSDSKGKGEQPKKRRLPRRPSGEAGAPIPTVAEGFVRGWKDHTTDRAHRQGGEPIHTHATGATIATGTVGAEMVDDCQLSSQARLPTHTIATDTDVVVGECEDQTTDRVDNCQPQGQAGEPIHTVHTGIVGGWDQNADIVDDCQLSSHVEELIDTIAKGVVGERKEQTADRVENCQPNSQAGEPTHIIATDIVVEGNDQGADRAGICRPNSQAREPIHTAHTGIVGEWDDQTSDIVNDCHHPGSQVEEPIRTIATESVGEGKDQTSDRVDDCPPGSQGGEPIHTISTGSVGEWTEQTADRVDNCHPSSQAGEPTHKPATVLIDC